MGQIDSLIVLWTDEREVGWLFYFGSVFAYVILTLKLFPACPLFSPLIYLWSVALLGHLCCLSANQWNDVWLRANNHFGKHVLHIDRLSKQRHPEKKALIVLTLALGQQETNSFTTGTRYSPVFRMHHLMPKFELCLQVLPLFPSMVKSQLCQKLCPPSAACAVSLRELGFLTNATWQKFGYHLMLSAPWHSPHSCPFHVQAVCWHPG